MQIYGLGHISQAIQAGLHQRMGAGVEHRNPHYGSCEFEAGANLQEIDIMP